MLHKYMAKQYNAHQDEFRRPNLVICLVSMEELSDHEHFFG